MKKWMIDCLEEAPDVCLKMLKENKAITNDLVKIYLSKQYKKVLLVGSGSSSSIANSSKYALQNLLDVRVEVVTPLTFAYYDFNHHEETFVICISQSGASTNTIAAVKKAKEIGLDVVAISTSQNSPISEYCDNTYSFGPYCDEKDCYVCRYFSSSVLYFYLFSLNVALEKGTISKERYNASLKQLEMAVKVMPGTIEATQRFYKSNFEELTTTKRIMVVGIGPFYGLANEACLKFTETTGIPTNGYETEEFLHGPVYECGKDHAVYLIDGDPLMHDRIMTVFDSLKELTDKVYLITYSNEVTGRKIINIPAECDLLFRPMLFVIPFQFIPGSICDDTWIRAFTLSSYRAYKKIKTKV